MADPFVAASSEVIGGALGKHARSGEPYRTWWQPVRILLAVTFLASTLSFATFEHCRASDWRSPEMYVHLCYSDSAASYTSRGLDQHRNPLAATAQDQPIAYPVITNLVIAATSWLVPTGTAPERRRTYFDINALLMVLALAMTVVVTARVADHWRSALFVAIAPAGILSLFIGWDALASLFTIASLAYFRSGSPWKSGILLGLAIATAFYPVLLVVALLLISANVRDSRLPHSRNFDKTAMLALATWGVIDLVVALFFFDGVRHFYGELLTQGASYGSLWMTLSLLFSWTPSALNALWIGAFFVGTLVLAVLIKRQSLRPSIAQVGLLVGAIYFLTAKAYSPQQVLWLIPLAALARLRWRDLIVWQVCEVIYQVGLWQYIAVVSDAKRGLDADAYGWLTALHLAGLVYLMWRTWQQLMSEARRDPLDIRQRHPESPELHPPAHS